jgi:hypothetical protein
MVDTPFLDVCSHDPMLTLVGTLPPAFSLFLRGLGHPASSVAGVARQVRYASVRHLKRVWVSYCSLFALTRALRDKELGRRRVTDVLLQGRQAMSMQRKRPPPVLVPVVAGLTSQLCDAALPEDVRRTGETRLDDVVTTGSSVSRALGRLG